ncbi:MAG: hypothetical protein LBG60_01390 [Bifidobacteriaceae bacterium]|jgi:hypothetical protein|nr:hypothetical protein [Bifidobacteriaceae bacterium]
MRRSFGQAFLAISSTAYLMLGVSALTALATAPAWGVALTTDLAATWPALVLAAPLAGPALYAAFACFSDHAQGGLKVFGVYARAWPVGLRRAGPFGLAASALGAVIAVDAFAAARAGAGTPALPALAALAVVGAVVAATFLTAVAAAQEFGSVRRRDLAKAALYCSVRRGGWSLFTLAALALWLAALTRGAVWALAVALGPALYLAWSNSRHVLAPLRAWLGEPRDGSAARRRSSADRPADAADAAAAAPAVPRVPIPAAAPPTAARVPAATTIRRGVAP